MKRSKIVFGLSAMLLAATGAFAAANAHTQQTYFFEESTIPCTSTEVDVVCEEGITGCVNDLGGKSSNATQLFADPECDTPVGLEQ